RLGAAAQLRVTGREKTIDDRVLRMLLQSEQQPWERLGELTLEEARLADRQVVDADAQAAAQRERAFNMLDCRVGLAGQQPHDAAQVPAAGEARVKGQCAVD